MHCCHLCCLVLPGSGGPSRVSLADHFHDTMILGAPQSIGGFFRKALLWAVLAFTCSTIIRFMLLTDVNKRVYNHTPGPCRVIGDINDGSAGMELVKEAGLLFISSGYAAASGVTTRKGIAYLDLNTKDTASKYVVKWINIEGDFDEKDFVPLGLSSYVSQGRITLYATNAVKPCVESFLLDKKRLVLRHRRSICNPAFTSLMDLAVVGADRFFATNLAWSGRGWPQAAELAMQTSTGSLLLFDGHTASQVESMVAPAGLAYDAANHTLYVGSLMNEVVSRYVVKQDLSLHSRLDISLLSSPAGLFVDEAGDVWVALHPVMYQLFLHQHQPAARLRSPSQVLRIRIQPDRVSWVVTEPYSNDGATVSGSHSVVFHEGQLIIGSLFGRTLSCDVLNPTIT